MIILFSLIPAKSIIVYHPKANTLKLVLNQPFYSISRFHPWNLWNPTLTAIITALKKRTIRGVVTTKLNCTPTSYVPFWETMQVLVSSTGLAHFNAFSPHSNLHSSSITYHFSSNFYQVICKEIYNKKRIFI